MAFARSWTTWGKIEDMKDKIEDMKDLPFVTTNAALA
jgi:hypothetical protein